MFMMCHKIGRPPISTIGFGTIAVSSASRVPRPPARRMVFIQALWIVVNPFYFASDSRTTTACPVGSHQGRSGPVRRRSRCGSVDGIPSNVSKSRTVLRAGAGEKAGRATAVDANFGHVALEPGSGQRELEEHEAALLVHERPAPGLLHELPEDRVRLARLAQESAAGQPGEQRGAASEPEPSETNRGVHHEFLWVGNRERRTLLT